jgi:hypothetical protein
MSILIWRSQQIMSKARDIANILSANTAIATDAEVTAAISSATSGLATASSVSTAVTNERSASATITNKTIDGNSNTINVKRGNTANRPASPTVGDQYYDTELSALLNYTGTVWEKISKDPAPSIVSATPTTFIAPGTISILGNDFKFGASISFVGTNGTALQSPQTTFNSPTSLTASVPQLYTQYEPYDIRVVNLDGQSGIIYDYVDAGSSPVWSTASGSIGSVYLESSFSYTFSATDPDGTSIVYSSSDKPEWLSLNSSSGVMSGTTPTVTSSTTYSFAVNASDGFNTSSRSFSLTVNPLPVDAFQSSVVFYLNGDSLTTDRTGRHTITNNNAATLTRPGSLSIAGRSTNNCIKTGTTTNNYLTISNNLSDFDWTSSAWTLEFWIYDPLVTTGRYYHLFVADGQGTKGTFKGYSDSVRQYSAYFYSNAGGGPGANLTTQQWNTANFQAQSWVHVAYERNSSNSGRLYINGVLTDTMTWNSPGGTPGSAVMGYWGGESAEVYFDEFRITRAAKYNGTNFTPRTVRYTY